MKRAATEQLSPATQAKYLARWREFELWCAAAGRESLPASPATTARFLIHFSDTPRAYTGKPPSESAIRLAVAAIRAAHASRAVPDPTAKHPVPAVLRGLQEERAAITADSRYLLTAVELERMVRATPPTVRGRRDRTALLLGYKTPMTAAALFHITTADIAFDSTQLVLWGSVTIPRESDTRVCPVHATTVWCSILSRHNLRGSLWRRVMASGDVRERGLQRKTLDRLVADAAVRANVTAAVTASSLETHVPRENPLLRRLRSPSEN